MEQLLINNELKLIVPEQSPPKSEKRKSAKEYIRWDNYNERGASLLKFHNVDFRLVVFFSKSATITTANCLIYS